MALFARDYNDILGQAILDLTNNSIINRISPGSKARAILEVFSRNVGQAYQTFDTNLTRAFLSGATGTYIDLIGELVATPRLGSTAAQASASSQTVKFYVSSGTFGDINGSSSITIPAGTLISTAPNASDVVYKMTTGVTLNSASTEQFITVEALTPGQNSNVGTNSLVYHNFTNYTDSSNNTLKVINLSGIFNGADTESDTNYKYRISQSTLGAEASNATAILLATLSTPGVANAILQNRAYGIGTYKVLIKSITPSVSAALLDNVQASIEAVSGLGILPFADKPNETGMEFSITVYYQNGTSDDDKVSIESQIISSLSDYVNNLDIGQEFILNQAVESVLSVSPNIKDIGIPGTPFDSVAIYQENRMRTGKIRQSLLGNYIPTAVERIIIEPSLQTPITILRG
jgi:hypothetical protein